VPDGGIRLSSARHSLEATSNPADDGTVRFQRTDVADQLGVMAVQPQRPGETEQRQRRPGQAVDQENAHTLMAG
jgi:hypothetical protein